MVNRAVSMDAGLWKEARERVGIYGSLSKTIRKLLHYWLKGEINLDQYPDIEE